MAAKTCSELVTSHFVLYILPILIPYLSVPLISSESTRYTLLQRCTRAQCTYDVRCSLPVPGDWSRWHSAERCKSWGWGEDWNSSAVGMSVSECINITKQVLLCLNTDKSLESDGQGWEWIGISQLIHVETTPAFFLVSLLWLENIHFTFWSCFYS